MRIKEPTGRLARWSLLLQQYDFEVRHRSGQSNGNADGLSRRPYPVNLTVIDIPGLQTEGIRNLQRRDADLSDTIAYLEDKILPAKDGSARALLLCVDNYFLDKDGILCHIWVPNKRHPRGMYTQLVVPAALRQEVLTAGHDDPTAGHLGTHKTYEKLRQPYY